MKIVFYRYNSICEPGYMEAFSSLGIEVVEETSEMYCKSISGDERIERIATLILQNRPMFVFSINFFPYISEICQRLNVMYMCVSVDCPVAELYSVSVKNSCNRIFLFDEKQYLDIRDLNPGHIFHLPLGAYNTERKTADPKYDISFIGSLYNEKNPFNTVISGADARIKGLCAGILAADELAGSLDFTEQIVGRLSHGADAAITGGTDPFSGKISSEIKQAFSPYLPEAIKNSGSYISDMTGFWITDSCFGFELTVRDRLLLLATLAAGLEGTAGVHLFTRSDTSVLTSLAGNICVHEGVDTLGRMPQIFAESKINLNTTMRSIRTGMPQRIWDIMGVGGFVLTDYRSDIDKHLVIGKHLDAYETPEEACEKARFYLEHDDIRREIADNGYGEVCRKHTILNRIATMISLINP